MDTGLAKRKTAGVAAPTASHSSTSESKTTPNSRDPQSGRKGLAALLGTALRHARNAQSLNLRRGPGAGVAREIQHARRALDSAEWACSYAEAES